MKKILAALVGAVVLLSGCGQEPPKCSDEQTQQLVRGIIMDQIGGKHGLAEEEVNAILKIEFPKATSYDETIKKYSCDAQLAVGDSYRVPIEYESQIDDNGEHVVSVGGMRIKTLLGLRFLVTENIKKLRSNQGNNAATDPEEK